MKNLVSKIWFPTVLIALAAFQTFGIDRGRYSGKMNLRDSLALVQVTDSLPAVDSVVSDQSIGTALTDSLTSADTITLSAADTIAVPDSLRYSDTLRFRYYIALKDSTTRAEIRDSLRNSGDSLELSRLDSLICKDSTETAVRDSIAHFNSLSRKEKKKYLAEIKMNRKMNEMNITLHRKDSLKAVKDSIIGSTPRILSTYAIPDSMQYKRMIMWDHDRYNNNLRLKGIDTTYNYHFNDYPFLKEDVNATYLGVIGSPTQTYNYFKREEAENAIFHTPYMTYNYTPETLPMYNTKTAYTELAYWGTLFANKEKEETNVRVMTTQNILPELNVTLEYDRFGSNGVLRNEDTDNRTFVIGTNYIGKKYLMHAGYIFNRIRKSENGGAIDNFWLRDTTVDSREIEVNLPSASNKLKKNTVFLDQSYRFPFSFVHKLGKKYRQEKRAEEALRDSIMTSGDSTAIEEYLQEEAEILAQKGNEQDTLDNNVTTAFIGHSSEYSVFTKIYDDKIGMNDENGREFYDNKFYINPLSSHDSTRVMKLDNRIYIRLQPWSSEGAVSKIDVGIGDKLLNYYDFNRTEYIRPDKNVVLNSVYLYAGAQGQIKKYMHWDAAGRYTFAGHEMNDFNVGANLSVNMYPFRRAKESPLNLNVHFETGLKEADWYQQHLHTNHYWWDNDFSKTSTTRVEAALNIPLWKLKVSFGYALLGNNLYYDNHGIIRQNEVPMSVMTAYVMKNFRAWKFHFDHQAMFQYSSNKDVLPLPMLALNFRYYFQFNVVRQVMQMQIGANATYTTKWHAPAYSPATGLFHNQDEELYGNCPYIDVFVNIQWKRACIFIKAVNLGMGWPNKSADYFSAHHYIRPQQSIKFGIFWPFYVQPKRASAYGDRNELGSSM